MSKPDKTIKQMSDEAVRTSDNYVAQGTKKWDWQTAAKDLPYQVGSVTKISMQMSGERWNDGKSKQQLKDELSDELADIIAVALFIAAKLDIDIEESWQKMLDSDKNKISSRSGK